MPPLKMGGMWWITTQFMTKTQPDRENFPMRNKVVAGMSDASRHRIGKKEDQWLQQNMPTCNKDVFAFPGRPTDENQGIQYVDQTNKSIFNWKC